jgi:26S proteasome regulatory subunit N6
MALCKVLAGLPEEVNSLFSAKNGMKYSGTELVAMSTIAKAAREKSLDAYKAAVLLHSATLTTDELISHHIDKLYDNMLESNLMKILAPYSAVQVSHVAKLINLPEDIVIIIIIMIVCMYDLYIAVYVGGEEIITNDFES